MGPIKVRKPRAILFDLCATATKSYFTDKILFPYIRYNCAIYLHNNWDNEVLQRDIQRLRLQSEKDGGPMIAPATANRDQIEDTVCKYVIQCLEDLRENDAINIFRLHMWFDGYHRDKIETPVYSDVAIQIKHWRINQNIKLYVLSNGWVEATKRFMAKTNHGDLNLLIDGHFDTTTGQLDQPDTFKKVAKIINFNVEEVLFLTKALTECKAALDAGLNAILVMTHRRDLVRLEEKDRRTYTYVRSFNEITFISDHSGNLSGTDSAVSSVMANGRSLQKFRSGASSASSSSSSSASESSYNSSSKASSSCNSSSSSSASASSSSASETKSSNLPSKSNVYGSSSSSSTAASGAKSSNLPSKSNVTGSSASETKSSNLSSNMSGSSSKPGSTSALSSSKTSASKVSSRLKSKVKK